LVLLLVTTVRQATLVINGEPLRAAIRRRLQRAATGHPKERRLCVDA